MFQIRKLAWAFCTRSRISTKALRVFVAHNARLIYSGAGPASARRMLTQFLIAHSRIKVRWMDHGRDGIFRMLTTRVVGGLLADALTSRAERAGPRKRNAAASPTGALVFGRAGGRAEGREGERGRGKGVAAR